jgi:glutamyl-tRNA(Gln) amidotransferase subunit D
MTYTGCPFIKSLPVTKCFKTSNIIIGIMATKFSIGDKVEVKTKEGKFTGYVMPSADAKILTIKLDSGYNMGLKLGKDVKIKKVGALPKEKPVPIKPPIKKNLPNVVIIATGGTITSKVDYTTGGVSPLTKPEDVLLATPELLHIVNVKKVISPFAIWSEDMSYVEWQKIAKEAAKELNQDDVSGVIVTHGTDFLHYTAAALSFMLKNLNKPVAVVGGQRSSDRGSFDGGMNLICAAHYCKSNIAEVAIVMHGNSADNFCIANRGVNTRKMHTSRRDAFRPINELPLAKIWPDGKIEVLNKLIRQRNDKERVRADLDFEPRIALLKFFPGANPEILGHFIDKGYKGIIIEAAGLGQVATDPLNKKNWVPTIKEAIDKGVFIGFAPQCLYGRLDPYVYSAGRRLLDTGAVHLGSMLAETALVKLGCVLAHTKSKAEVKDLMLKNVAGEIVEKISPESYLY